VEERRTEERPRERARRVEERRVEERRVEERRVEERRVEEGLRGRARPWKSGPSGPRSAHETRPLGPAFDASEEGP
jgi:hypothetical protein